MQINIALNNNNREQAEKLRKIKYPNTTAKQTRDSFIFNECIDNFQDFPEALLEYIRVDENEQNGKEQRMLTIKNDSNERLKTLASALNTSIAATYRSIIAYSIDKINEDSGKITRSIMEKENDNAQLIIEKVALLETELAACNSTIKEIRNLLGK